MTRTRTRKTEADLDREWARNRYAIAMECPRCEYVTPALTLDVAQRTFDDHMRAHAGTSADREDVG